LSLPKSIYEKLPKRKPHSLGFSRYALDFDGVDDYVETGANVTVSSPTITFSMWYKPHEFSGTRMIQMEVHTADYRDIYFEMDNNAGYKGWKIYDTGGTEHRIAFAKELTVGTWYHIVGTYDGSYQRLYFNGKEDANSPLEWSGDFACDDLLYIGDYPSWNIPAKGVIDEVKVYDRDLSAEEVRENMLNYHNPAKNGLVGWWRFEEGTGLTAYDYFGNNDGTLNPSGDPPVWADIKKWELRAEVGL